MQLWWLLLKSFLRSFILYGSQLHFDFFKPKQNLLPFKVVCRVILDCLNLLNMCLHFICLFVCLFPGLCSYFILFQQKHNALLCFHLRKFKCKL